MTVAIALPAVAQSNRVDELLQELSRPDLKRWERVQSQIVSEWSKSGSPAMDLLLQRGQEALENGDAEAAIDHLTALTDHAPEFAEGWNRRAQAYFQTGRYGPAMADLSRVLALNPNHFAAIMGLGLILEDTGQEERALEVFRAAHAIHPHHPEINRAVERLERRTSGHDA